MGRLSRSVHVLTLLILGLAGTEVSAQPRPSLQAANLNPLVQIYGLPRITQGPEATGEIRIGLDLDWASHAVTDTFGRGFVRLDGETRRYTLKAVGSLPSTGVWWALELPFVSHSGGRLDSLIEDWHDRFGLPGGNRSNRPQDALLYQVVDGSGRQRLLQTRSASGFGDAAFSMGWPLSDTVGTGLRIEAPTGDPDRLLGSGGWDAAGWLGWSGGWAELSWHLAGGGLYIANSEVLPELQRSWAPLGRLAAGWQAWQPFMLHAQLDSHGPLYDSPGAPLGQTAIELRLGAKWDVGGGFRAAAGFSEDLNVGAAPDITFHLQLSQGLSASPTAP